MYKLLQKIKATLQQARAAGMLEEREESDIYQKLGLMISVAAGGIESEGGALEQVQAALKQLEEAWECKKEEIWSAGHMKRARQCMVQVSTWVFLMSDGNNAMQVKTIVRT